MASLKLVLKRPEAIENELGLKRLRHWFSLRVQIPLLALHRPTHLLRDVLREQYMLFDVKTPRGTVLLKHVREDDFYAALCDLAGRRTFLASIEYIVSQRVDELIA